MVEQLTDSGLPTSLPRLQILNPNPNRLGSKFVRNSRRGKNLSGVFATQQKKTTEIIHKFLAENFQSSEDNRDHTVRPFRAASEF
ncbi:hypothetical protein SUGI_0460430 [Cryptomeria japonica]|nr:hypothetical protein SUGI_0460430 [Cryptomeria japonica]